jgi:hypothetical protein
MILGDTDVISCRFLIHKMNITRNRWALYPQVGNSGSTSGRTTVYAGSIPRVGVMVKMVLKFNIWVKIQWEHYPRFLYWGRTS